MHDCVTCGREYSSKRALSYYHYNDNPNHAPDDWTECPKCGKKFEQIGSHFGQLRSHEPDLSTKQVEIITGCLMGDGYIRNRDRTPRFGCNMTNQSYLHYLDSELGIISNGVILSKTAKSAHNDSVNRSDVNEGSLSDYNDIYTIMTVPMESLQKFANWYGQNGEKVYPDTIDLTPTILRHWFVGDGFRHKSEGYIGIACKNESDNQEKIERMFTKENLPKPVWDQYKMRWRKSDSNEVIKYMEQPLPGFGYKFGGV